MNQNKPLQMEQNSQFMQYEFKQNEAEIIEQSKRLFSAGKITEAIKICVEAIQKNSNFVKLTIQLTQFYQHNSEFDLMLKAALLLQQQQPSNPIVAIRKCECLIYAGEIKQAISAIDKLFKKAPQNHQLLSKLAELYLHCSQHKKVLACHLQVFKLSPKNVQYKYNLASAHLTVGNLSKAKALLDEVIQESPQDFDAYYNRSTLKTHSVSKNNIAELQQALAKYSNSVNAKIALGYALGKELEDIGDYPQAFAAISTAASSRKKAMRYQVSTDTQAMATIKQCFSKQKLSQVQSSSNQSSPIFILGLPRSGTTLVERLLSSHSSVGSLGEVNNFAFSMIHCVGPNQGKLDLIEKSIHVDFDELANRYQHATEGYGIKGDLLIDKTPLNFLYIGLIKKAFPKAKIIHLKRHPLDSCFAMYKTLFRMGYPFSYSLEDLAEYYLAYHQLMAHWRDIFADEIYDLEYQKLVNHPDQEAAKLLEYCQLEWQPEIMDFHKSSEPTATASAAQVRKPIYKTSVNRWSKYDVELKPLIKILTENGIACD